MSTMTISDEYYLNPENIGRMLSDEKGKQHILPGKKADIFAIGIMFLEIIHGERPQIDDKDGKEFMLWNETATFNAAIEVMNTRFANYPGGPELTDYVKTRILNEDKDQVPKCSDIFKECPAIKAMA